MRRRAVRVFAMFAVAGAAACGGEGPLGVPEIEGIYTLRLVNGVEVPTLFAVSGATRVDILTGTMTLADDGTYSATHSFRATESDESFVFAADCSGTYTVRLDGITFQEDESPQCGGTYAAVLDGDTYTVTYNEGFEATYSR